ncbi:hypothetical protein BDP27DRAFT_1314570, partial [Rhodocollybia butyracea]
MGSSVPILYNFKGSWAPSLKNSGEWDMVYFTVTEEGSEACFGWAALGPVTAKAKNSKEGVRVTGTTIYAAVSSGDPATQEKFKALVEPPDSDQDDPTHNKRTEWVNRLDRFNDNFMNVYRPRPSPSAPSFPGMDVPSSPFSEFSFSDWLGF